jgi:hypothetical protein
MLHSKHELAYMLVNTTTAQHHVSSYMLKDCIMPANNASFGLMLMLKFMLAKAKCAKDRLAFLYKLCENYFLICGEVGNYS